MSDGLTLVGDEPVGETLALRPSRQIDATAENRGLAELAHALACEPDAVMQRLTDLVVDIAQVDAAGISMFAREPDRIFRWRAVSGAWAGHAGKLVRFRSSPCSVAVDRRTPVLLARPECEFSGWDIDPPAEEALMVPLRLRGAIVGTLWAVQLDGSRPLDSAVAGLLRRLDHFAVAAARMSEAEGLAGLLSKEADSDSTSKNEARRGPVDAIRHSLLGRRRQQPETSPPESGPYPAERASIAAMLMRAAGHRQVLDALTYGFCTLALRPGPEGAVFDGTIIDANAAFSRAVGRSVVVGKPFSTVAPSLVRDGHAILERVAASGRQEHFDSTGLGDGRIFTIDVVRIGEPEDRQVSILLRNVTDERRLEAALGASEAQRDFVLRFSEALRPLSDPFEIEEAAVHRLSKHLDADYAAYSGFDPSSALPINRRENFRYGVGGNVMAEPIAQSPSLLAHMRAGTPLIIEDLDRAAFIGREERAHLTKYGLRSCIAVPLIKRNKLAAAMTVYQTRPRKWTNEEVRLVREVVESTCVAAERVRTEAALRESEKRFRTLTNSVPAFVWLAGPDGGFTYASDRGRKFVGLTLEEARGEGWKNAIHPDDIPRVEAAWAEACAKGTIYEIEGRHRLRSDGSYRWQLARAEPMRNEAGAITCWFGTTTDIDDLRRLQEHQKLLLAELQHRVRNTLAVVRSIARRTAATSSSIDEFVENFDGRIDAFARTQSVVTRDPTKGVGLDYIVAEEMLAFCAHERAGGREGGQLRIEGPEVRFQAKAAETFALAVHELATNAVKHGALSSGGASPGRVVITWRVEPPTSADAVRTLVFSWVESRVATPVVAPRKRGFGMELLERTLRFDLKADTTLDFDPGGIRCTIAIPLTKRTAWDGVSQIEA